MGCSFDLDAKASRLITVMIGLDWIGFEFDWISDQEAINFSVFLRERDGKKKEEEEWVRMCFQECMMSIVFHAIQYGCAYRFVVLLIVITNTINIQLIKNFEWKQYGI